MKKVGVTNYVRHKGEDCSGEIKTKPDQGLSIKMLFEKYRKSGTVPATMVREGGDQFAEDDDPDPDAHHDLEKIAAMEIHDIRELKEAAEADTKVKRERVDAMKKVAAEKKAAREKEIQESIDYAKANKDKALDKPGPKPGD